jgi:hypothetical protein
MFGRYIFFLPRAPAQRKAEFLKARIVHLSAYRLRSCWRPSSSSWCPSPVLRHGLDLHTVVLLASALVPGLAAVLTECSERLARNAQAGHTIACAGCFGAPTR